MQKEKSKKIKNEKKKSSGIVSRYAIGAIPYRFGIRMPLLIGENGRPDRLMRDADFAVRFNDTKTLRDFVKNFIDSHDEFRNYEDEVSGLRIPKTEVDETNANEIRCVIYTGKYGYESELLNVETEEVIQRTVNDCELIPFACRIVFNPPHQMFVVIFERIGNASCVGAFVRALNDYVKMRFMDKDYRVDYGYITNLKYVERQFRNNVKAIHLVRYKKASMLEDCLDYDDDTQELVKVDVRISAQRGGFLQLADKIKDFTKKDFAGVVLANEEYPAMNVELKSGKRTQTVFAGRDAFLVPFDVTDKMNDLIRAGQSSLSAFCGASQECLDMSKCTLFGDKKEVKK